MTQNEKAAPKRSLLDGRNELGSDEAEEEVEGAGEQRGGGEVKTHPAAMLRIVVKRRPFPLAAMVPATPELRIWVVLTGSPELSAAKMVPMAIEAGACTLSVGQVIFADAFAHCDDNALPADHRAEAERERYCDLNPGGNELGGVVGFGFVAFQGSAFFSGEGRVCVP